MIVLNGVDVACPLFKPERGKSAEESVEATKLCFVLRSNRDTSISKVSAGITRGYARYKRALFRGGVQTALVFSTEAKEAWLPRIET